MRHISYKIGTKVKPNINSVEVYLGLSNNIHLVDGALVHVDPLWLCWINFEWKMARRYAPIPQHSHSEAPSTNI